MSNRLLEVIDLKTYFYLDGLTIKAVDGVSFELNKGEILGLVGESGCGKSVTALSIIRLIQSPPGRIYGKINFNRTDLMELKEKEMCRVRGRQISIIFQEPRASLNPLFTIGDQILEAIIIHQHLSKGEALEKAIQMLGKVGLPDPANRMKDYPHQLSGGMCQRAIIAMALVLHPSLLIADEPTTALDVTIQAQILWLLRDLRTEFDLSVLLITHDLGVVAETCDRVAVMYAGKIIEYASTLEIFENPRHPYTQCILQSMPRLGLDSKRLTTIKGVVPNLGNLPGGCGFHPRCPLTSDSCRDQIPKIREILSGHWVRCFNTDNGSKQSIAGR
jgi:peptide/nickel transport system ATP-binding protein/oligopeptide transport system ATP-binding protein